MKTYFRAFFAAGLFGALIFACSSSDDVKKSAAVDAGLADGAITPPTSGDDDDSGTCAITSALTACDCDPKASINANKPVCGCPGVTGQIGTGRTIGSAGGQLTCGAVDAANDRLVMGVSSIEGGSIWTVDLKTGNRVLVSGTITDPATGAETTATGDAMLPPSAIRIGTDGWYALEGTSAAKQIQKIDPASGARTPLLTLDQMKRSIDGGHPIACIGGPALDTSAVVAEAGMGLGPANEAYVVMGKAPGYVAVARLTFGAAPACTIVSGDNYDSPGSNLVGTGPLIEGIGVIDFANGTIYALDVARAVLFSVGPVSGVRTIVSHPPSFDAGTIVDAGDAGDANPANGNGTGNVTPTACFTDATSGGSVFAFSPTTAWSGTAKDSAGDFFAGIDLASGARTCFAPKVACHPGQTNGQAIDRSAGVFIGPTTGQLLTAGATTIWLFDTTTGLANVLSE